MPVSAYLQAAFFVIMAAVALFAAAGTVAIVGFWLYLAIFAVVMIASFALLDPGLLRERMRPGGQRPPLGLRLFTLVLLAHCIIAGLDRGRFHWSDSVPPWLQGVGLLAVAAGYALALWAMRVNRFFSSVVRIQTDRGQHVITTGPYAVIRHPGYLAGASSSSWRAGLGSARGWRRRWWSSAACRFCSTVRSRKTGFFTQSFRVIATTPAGFTGASCREFGELEEGLTAPCKSDALIDDSHKTYYGIS